MGLVAGTLAAVLVAFLSEDAFGSCSTGVIPIGGQGAAFLAASVAFIVDVVLSVVVSLVTKPKPVGSAGRARLLRDADGEAHRPEGGQLPVVPRTVPLAGIVAGHGHRPERGLLRRPTWTDKKAKKTAGALDIRNIIGVLLAIYGVILLLMGIFGDSAAA